MLTSKICPRCGHEAKGGASFCERCGMQLGSTAVATDPTLDVAVDWTRRLLVPILICAIAALAMVVWILEHKLESTEQDLTAAQAVVLSKTKQANAGTDDHGQGLPTPATPGTTGDTTTPAANNDVGQYLTFLKDIDRRRMALVGTANHVPVSGGTPDGAGGDPVQAWQVLDQDFHAVIPPPSCNTMAGAYATLITDSATYATHPAGGAYAAPALSPSQLTADAARADTEVAKVCQQYGIVKPFTINSVP